MPAAHQKTFVLLLLLSSCLWGCDPSDNEEAEPIPEPTFCESHEWTERSFLEESEATGIRRHDTADSFRLELMDESRWDLDDHWTGCDSYMFLTDRKTVSAMDSRPLWDVEEDLVQLVQESPRNVHYFFVAVGSETTAEESLQDLNSRVGDVLDSLDEDDAAWWGERLHVVGEHRNDIGGWVEDLLDGDGKSGFLIDRMQQIRLVGNYADVNRYSAALNSQGAWPWEGNLAYAAHEVRASNFRSDREDRLAAETDVTHVLAWSGEVLQGTVETDVVFPDRATLDSFDTLEIDLLMDCPDPEEPESGFCGAWDYLAHLYLLDDEQTDEGEDQWIEVARFITTYHREGRYLVDATPMLVHLGDGGTRTLRYTLSPPWNEQAYLTEMDFRFSNRGKGYRPTSTVDLFTGGALNSSYNTDRESVTATLPDTVARVEVWALITGHGMDDGNCAEFCDHHHEFTVNGTPFTKEHPEVGNQEGCIDQIENGMTPNQGGTWWFGRGGWCPGQQVEPWTADATSLTEPGGTVTVSYRGLINGSDPPDNSGTIHLTSYLVIYE